jgi:hypothetical protein
MSENKIQSSVLGASGEHLILSHLLRLNFIAGKAPDNTKDYDLIVLNKDGTTSSPIQVKTTSQTSGWVLNKKHETPIKDLIFCFVYMDLNSNFNEIFVVDSKTVANFVKLGHQIWLKIPGQKGQKHNDSDMRRLERVAHKNIYKIPNYEKYLNETEIEYLKNYQENWIKKYKDNWQILKK